MYNRAANYQTTVTIHPTLLTNTEQTSLLHAVYLHINFLFLLVTESLAAQLNI